MDRPAAIRLEVQGGRQIAFLTGSWTLVSLPESLAPLEAQIRELASADTLWNLEDLARIDSAGAVLLWRCWNRSWPADVCIPDAHRHVLERVERLPPGGSLPPPGAPHDSSLEWFGLKVLGLLRHLRDAVTLIGALLLDIGWLLRHPREIPFREFSATLYKAGSLALPVTALVGFLIGVVLSYLSSLQLRLFGAETFIVNILGMSIIRELGPVLVAVLVAGRSGSAMTAQIGVMRVTEEIDALATMGVSRTLRLVLPKVAALAVAMPLLTVWCSAAGILGGLVSANLQLDLSWGFFMEALPRSVPLPNLWIGLSKGFVFGLLIGLIACHFGLRVKPNTESLSTKTTASVVTSITVVILVDAVFAIFTRSVGLPAV